MGKSIEEILRQIESERNLRINEEQSKLDEINHQRDLARKEWTKRMRMYESLSSNTSTSAGAGAGGGGSIIVEDIVSYSITGITYSLRNDNFWYTIDLLWDVNPASVEPNWNNTNITIEPESVVISNITIFNSGTANMSGSSFDVSRTGAGTLTGSDTIIVSVLTTTGQYATGSIGPLDFRSGQI